MSAGADGLAEIAGRWWWLLLAAGVAVTILRFPVPVRLRARVHGLRVLLAMDVGWPWLAYRHRVRWRPDRRVLVRRALRLPGAPGLPRPVVSFQRRALPPRKLLASPAPAAGAVRALLRTAGSRRRLRLERLDLHARLGVGDAAGTALAAGALAALARALGAVLEAVVTGPRPTLRLSVQPDFSGLRFQGELDCIVRVPAWDLMIAARRARGGAAKGGTTLGEHAIQGLMQTAMESLKQMVDVNTVVGDAVEAKDGTVIVPVSRVSVGFVAGGGEYGREPRRTDTGHAAWPFAGGSGAGVSVQPVGFLVVGHGRVRLLPVAEGAFLDRIIDAAPEVIDRVRGMFGGRHADGMAQPAGTAATAAGRTGGNTAGAGSRARPVPSTVFGDEPPPLD